ncbi:MAG: tetratricopeptide repeat protein [Caulobacter sp.]|nr:tetratricopeptide repeat protein [Caulobacter sp.]
MIVKALAVAAVAATVGVGVAAPGSVRAASVAAKPVSKPVSGPVSKEVRTVLYGPPSAWVKPAETPPAPEVEPGTPFSWRLLDQQARFTPDGDESYTDLAFKILTEDGLAAGSLTLDWDPASESVTVHRLAILRDGQEIDVLKSDKFEVLRRETNLESAMLDGRLTAALQVKGLRVGDTLLFATTRRYRDPIPGSRAEWRSSVDHSGVAPRVRIRALWTKDRPMRWLKGSDLPAPTLTETAEGSELLLDLKDVKAPNAPTGAPMRYAYIDQLSLSGFETWRQVSALMAPLYAKAATLESGSPLEAEVARIKAASPDPAVRAALALKLVQSQVRYVFVGLDGAGRKPAAADDTWRHRFGDCKGKTALLLALLARLDIPAEAALANSSGRGDGIDQRLPGQDMFDHVLVRATIGGKVYWLDGTRSGDENIANIEPPTFRWVLPLRAEGAELEKIQRGPVILPYGETVMKIDASAGADAPAEVTIQAVLRGDQAIESNRQILGTPRDEVVRSSLRAWNEQLSWVDFTDIDWSYDADAALFVANLRGKGKIHWWPVPGGLRQWDLDGSGVTFSSYQRDSVMDASAPYAVVYPAFGRWTTAVILPDRGEGFQARGKPLDEEVGGMKVLRSYDQRHGRVVAVRSLRAVSNEISAEAAKASTQRAREGVGVVAVLTLDKESKDAPKALPQIPDPGPLSAGYEAWSADREDEALRLFQKARDAQPENDKAWLAMVNLLTSRKDYAGALKLCDQAARKSSVGADGWRSRRAEVLIAAGRVDEAVAELEKGLAAKPDDKDLLLVLARAHARQDKPDLARKDLDRAVAAAPTDPAVQRARAWNALQAKEYDDAITRYEAMAAQDPDDQYRLMNLSNAYDQAKRPKEALRLADEALRIDPFDTGALSWRAELHNRQGHYDLALADADSIVALWPEAAMSWNTRCWTRVTAGKDLDKALADCDAGLKLRPRSAAILDSRGLVQLRRGELRAAMADYDAALALEPRQAASLYGRGLTKEKLGDQTGGRADLAAASAIDRDIAQRFAGYGLKAE